MSQAITNISEMNKEVNIIKKYPASRYENLVVQEVKGEVLIYDLKTNKAYCLNETSALVWELCDGHKSVLEISRAMTEKLKIPVTEDLVWLALQELKKNKLTFAEELPVRFEGLSRREVIRQVGFASMVALPLVSSLIAPPAAQAQSAGACGAAGQVCCSGSSCNTGLSCGGGGVTNTCCIPNFSTVTCTSSAQCCSGSCGIGSSTCVAGEDGEL